MPLFGRHRAAAPYDTTANVTPRRRGWALFSPYPQRNRANPNDTYTTTTRRTFKGRTNDATMDPTTRRGSRRIGRTNEAYQRVPFATKVKRTLGIQSRGRQRTALGGLPVDTAMPPRGGGGGLFGRNTPGVREPQRNRGWFSGSGGRYRTQ